MLIAVIAAAAAAAGAAAYFRKKVCGQLDVTALENAVLEKYPGAVIKSIEKTMDNEDIYLVRLVFSENEYLVFITSKGEIINTSPETEESEN